MTVYYVLVKQPLPECVNPPKSAVKGEATSPGSPSQRPVTSNLGGLWSGGLPGEIKQPRVGGEAEGAHHMPRVEMCTAVSSGLGGEEQAGESPAAAVSVHEGQWVLGVVLNHGSHGGEELQEEAGRLGVS